MNLQSITNACVGLSAGALFACLAWLALRVARLANARERRAHWPVLASRVHREASVVVRCLESLSPRHLQKGHRSKPLSAKVTKALREAALAQLKLALGPAFIAELEALFGGELDDVDRLLGVYIEAAVYDLHRELARPKGAVRKPSTLENCA